MVLDLSLEKIWDKEKRYKEYVKEKCAQAKKIISAQNIDKLLSKVGIDLVAIQHETEKLITYVGSRNVIEYQDIKEISTTHVGYTLWQVAEKIVWEKKINIVQEHIDSSFFHGLVQAIRYQLQLGLKIQTFLESKKPIPAGYFKMSSKLFFKRQKQIEQF